MRHTATIFTFALVVFWLASAGLSLRWPMRRAALEPASFDYRINVNTADAATLQLLPGIGPSLGRHVVEHRQAHGPFERAAELENVHRIGPHTRRDIEPWVRLGDAARQP